MNGFLSDRQIEGILSVVESAWKHNKCPENKKTNFLLTLKSYIEKPEALKNVCPICMGTGKKIAEGIKRIEEKSTAENIRMQSEVEAVNSTRIKSVKETKKKTGIMHLGGTK